MPTDVVMPQMGESIFEGTITKWLKKPGDAVQRDEPLFEISTDKVDAEIPSPGAGVLTEIKVQEGATVQINTVVAVIGESGSANGAVAQEKAASIPAEPEKASAAVAAPAEAPAPASGPATEVVMPQMGESIFEGTITKWLKQVGESVERDEPLFEISTDKVDAEIPSPVAGTLTEVKVPAGATVQINTVVGLIVSAAGAGVGTTGPSPVPAAATAPSTAAASAPSKVGETEIDTQRPVPAAAQASVAAAEKAQTQMVTDLGHAASTGAPLRSSPLVRRIAKDHNLDLSQVTGTGSAGRITKDDVLGFMEKGGGVQAAPAAVEAPKAAAAPAAPVPAPQSAAPAAKHIPASTTPSVVPGELVPMSRMRSIIAARMVESKHTNAHVHTVFKIDMTRIVRLREKEKNRYEQRNGVKLTYMPFIARALVSTLRKMPIINASIEGDAIRYHQNINLGIAVALDWGLIVPVIKQAEERSFLGIARSIVDLAERARGKKLKPDEVGTSTFTITNAGIYGEQFGTPVINMPESAILGIGGLLKEPAVVTDDSGSDSIAIRNMIHLTLGFDHRIIDGADAGKFMSEVKKYLENWSEDIG